MRSVRDPGALSGAHAPAVGPGPPVPVLLSPGVLSGVLKRRTTGIRLIARRSVSTTGNVTLKLPRGPLPTVSRQSCGHRGGEGPRGAGPTRRTRDATGRGPTRHPSGRLGRCPRPLAAGSARGRRRERGGRGRSRG